MGGEPSLLDALHASPNRLTDTVRAVATWLALIDGPISDDERRALEDALDHEPSALSVERLEAWLLAPEANTREVPRLLRLLRSQRSPGRTPQILDLCLRIAGADGRVVGLERAALMLVSDVLAAPASLLQERCETVLGIDFLPPDDLSEPEVHRERERRVAARLAEWQKAQVDAAQAAAGRRHRDEALATLGLKDGATPVQVKAAWRKWSRQYHPDRHPGADAATAAQMAQRFDQVQKAWALLREDE